MNQSVAIIGAGIGGLTAAHELVKRGFHVTLYERRSEVGGKALSQRVDFEPGGAQLPTEHGFRFFPGWYQHLLATMKDIPVAKREAEFPAVNVATNLVRTESSKMLWSTAPAIPVPMHLPRNVSQAREFLDFLKGMYELGLDKGEVGFFFQKLVEFMATPEELRQKHLTGITWWQYVEAEEKSEPYKHLITATTRTLIAANAKEASAYTLGRLAIRTLSDALGGIDHVLNGPTSEAWLDAWRTHLERQGVLFRFGFELESIQVSHADLRIDSVEVSSMTTTLIRKLRRLLPTIAHHDAMRALGDEQLYDAKADEEARRTASILLREIRRPIPWGAPVRMHLGRLAELLREQSGTERWADKRSDGGNRSVRKKLKLTDELTAIMDGLWSYEEENGPVRVEADQFVFALPVEQMAYYVNRSSALKTLAPELRGVVRLASSTDWMAGIQIFLNRPIDLGKGHVILMDSPWAITAIEQRKLWSPAVELPAGIQSILSIDIANWSSVGRFNRRRAADCTDDEIAEEVWGELKAALNRSDKKVLEDEHLLRHPKLTKNLNYCIAESIVDLFDRKKQAAYEKARSVPASVMTEEEGGLPTIPFIAGPRLRFNSEPLLVNRIGTHALRPRAATTIKNMFLAADYVETETDLACMEGANEAARMAVNALLKRVGSDEPECPLWKFSVPQSLTSQLLAVAKLDGVAPVAAASSVATKVADEALDLAGRAGSLLRGWMKRG